MFAASLILAASSMLSAPAFPETIRGHWEVRPADCRIAPQKRGDDGYLLFSLHKMALRNGELVYWHLKSTKHPSRNAYIFDVEESGRDETADMTFNGTYHVVVNANTSITVWGDDEVSKRTYTRCPSAHAFGANNAQNQ